MVAMEIDDVCQTDMHRFLDDLLDYESGIQNDLYQWYKEHMDECTMLYPKVVRPGVLMRDPHTGEAIKRKMSIKDYFLTLGVENSFSYESKSCLLEMKCKAINPWGFVGFQFGEAILISLGYYRPEMVWRRINGIGTRVPRYYAGFFPDSMWMNGNEESLVYLESRACHVVTTHTNFWKGSFTGKGGIYVFDDMRRQESQFHLVKESISYNLDMVERIVGNSGMTNFFRMHSCTLSSVVAASHLCGPVAVSNLIKRNESAMDELGTDIKSYIDKFCGYF